MFEKYLLAASITIAILAIVCIITLFMPVGKKEQQQTNKLIESIQDLIKERKEIVEHRSMLSVYEEQKSEIADQELLEINKDIETIVKNDETVQIFNIITNFDNNIIDDILNYDLDQFETQETYQLNDLNSENVHDSKMIKEIDLTISKSGDNIDNIKFSNKCAMTVVNHINKHNFNKAKQALCFVLSDNIDKSVIEEELVNCIEFGKPVCEIGIVARIMEAKEIEYPDEFKLDSKETETELKNEVLEKVGELMNSPEESFCDIVKQVTSDYDNLTQENVNNILNEMKQYITELI